MNVQKLTALVNYKRSCTALAEAFDLDVSNFMEMLPRELRDCLEKEENTTTKVVVHPRHGGFGLSKRAHLLMTTLSGTMYNGDIQDLPRHYPFLVKVVEELGSMAHCDADRLGDHHRELVPKLEVMELKGTLFYISEYDGAETVHTPADDDKKVWKWATETIHDDQNPRVETLAPLGTWVCDECDTRTSRENGPLAWHQIILGYDPDNEWWCPHCRNLTEEALELERKERKRGLFEDDLIFWARVHDDQEERKKRKRDDLE